MRCQRSGARRVGVDVENFASGSVGIKICNSGSNGTAVIQEDERDVVRLFDFVLATQHIERDRALRFMSIQSHHFRKGGDFRKIVVEINTVCHCTGTPVAFVI